MTSLATSPAISSYSLYSNGFVITGPEDNRSQSVNNLNYPWHQMQMQHLQSVDSLPNGRGKRHSYSSDSDSRNRLDLDRALEALQCQQLQLQHENHQTASSALPHPIPAHSVRIIVQNGKGDDRPEKIITNVHQQNVNPKFGNDYNNDVDDDDDALSVENTRL